MRLKLSLVGEAQHLVIDTCRIAHTQYRDATIHELLADPIDSHIRLCTDQHLALTTQSLADGFH